MRNWSDVLPPEVAAEQDEWEVVQSAVRMMKFLGPDEIERRLGSWAWMTGLWGKHKDQPSPVERYLGETIEVKIIAVYLKLEYRDPADLADELVGTCRSLHDVLTPRELNDRVLLEGIEADIFQCEGCGWWCELGSEESEEHPGSCTDCAAEQTD